MNLKELTWTRHELAETTPFMKSLFERSLPIEQWVDFTYQKMCVYTAIEQSANEHGLLDDLADMCRSGHLHSDIEAMRLENKHPDRCYEENSITAEYCAYLDAITDPDKILAHLYVWHMGDMYGGQMIAKLIEAPHTHLVFENRAALIAKLREKLHDGLAEEANAAFDWAIKLLKVYDR